MNIVTMKLMENNLNIPLDLLRFISEFSKNEEINNSNFNEAIHLWFEDKEKCIFRFGHISKWNVSKVTNMSDAFKGREDFNEDISKWNVNNVVNM